jgi:RNA polymerase-interacting CarD/CdnL/TRCF family regulator
MTLGGSMFQKKDIIYSETLGVCKVEEITKLTQKNGDTVMYYGLRSLKEGKTAYIPVENHSVVLRELIDGKTAEEIKQTRYENITLLEQYEVDYVLQGGN